MSRATDATRASLPDRRGLAHRIRGQLVNIMLVALWLAILGWVAIFQPWMLSGLTITSVLQFSTLLALVSLGVALVMLAGGNVDLSVGGTTSMAAVTGALALGAGMPPALLLPACLIVGGFLGAVNGILVTWLRLMPLIVTLGTFYAYSGAALAITGGAALSGVPAGLTDWGRGLWGAFPLPFVTVVLPLFAAAMFVLYATSWGRWILAAGENENAARLAGLPVDRIRLLLFTLSGTLAGAAGFVSLAWLGSARPNIGVNLELEALTAVMLGGVAINGGRGGLAGVFAAVLLIVTLKTTMLQSGLNTVWQVGAIGLLLVVVLFANRFAHSRK